MWLSVEMKDKIYSNFWLLESALPHYITQCHCQIDLIGAVPATNVILEANKIKKK
jgi:hypothetical protein